MKLTAAWDRYWYRPFPVVYLAIARIVAVSFQIMHISRSHPGELRRLASLPDALYDPIPLLHLLLLPFGWHYRPSLEILEFIHMLTFVVGWFCLFGICTNLNLTLFAVGNLVMQGYLYSFHDIHHGQTAMMIFLPLLAISPAGRALSIDPLIKKTYLKWVKRKTMAFNPVGGNSRFCLWPLLVMHWVFALIYLSAAKGKWANGVMEWANGHTLQFYFFEYSIRKGVVFGEWFGGQHILALFFSWLTIFFESTFWFILFAPKLALLYAPMGLLFHLGIALTLKANFYSFMALYIVFLPWLVPKKLKDAAGTGKGI